MTSATNSINIEKKKLLIKALNGSLPAASKKLGITIEEAEKIILSDNDDSLDYDHNLCRLVIKALNACNMKKEAAAELGISEKTIFRYIAQYNIVRIRQGKKYIYFSTNKND